MRRKSDFSQAEDADPDRAAACLECWLRRATAQEIQARQTRTLLTLATVAMGAALSVLLGQGDSLGFGVVPIFLLLSCAIFLNHYYDWKTAAWKKVAEAIQEFQCVTALHSDFQHIHKFTPDHLFSFQKKKMHIVVFDVPTLMLYVVSLTILIILSWFALDRSSDGGPQALSGIVHSALALDELRAGLM